MKDMKKLILLSKLCLLILFYSCEAQPRHHIGGPCEGCEAIYEYANKKLAAIDTLPEFWNNEPKMKITGTVYHLDGKTAAQDVIIYIYHTNRKGIYQTKGNEAGWAKRHGYIRGWVKTNKEGKFTFYSFRPASYPDGSEPEHIHITIKEPGKNEYYLDEYFFTDDPLFTNQFKSRLKNRGGSGVVVPKMINGMWFIHRDLILGKNIPDYY
ncbi:hypothetical protein GCM10022216_08510 [Sphingobacterium kyonggiense]|uniref:Protocatechuate 3,4-dioxygenase beta subunit n=2 Tax=Sphingobacterium kyonggiense TaxID=714075 RepID=A0ABP7YF12_9SPHI